jgi:hypothetical protein
LGARFGILVPYSISISTLAPFNTNVNIFGCDYYGQLLTLRSPCRMERCVLSTDMESCKRTSLSMLQFL